MRALIASLAVLATACTEAPIDDTSTAPPEAPAAEPAPAAPTAEPAAEATKIPPAFHGRWDASAEACAAGSDMKLTITESELLFHESVGKPTSVAPRGPDAIQVEADFQGEGEEWTGVLELSLASDTLSVTQRGATTSRVRCP